MPVLKLLKSRKLVGQFRNLCDTVHTSEQKNELTEYRPIHNVGKEWVDVVHGSLLEPHGIHKCDDGLGLRCISEM